MAESTKVGSIFYEANIDSKGVEVGATNINQSLAGLTSSFNGLGSTIKSFGAILGVALSAKVVIDFLKNVTMTAARTETLGVAMYAVAKATNTSTEELEKQEKILKKQGITTQESRSILTLFMQSQLDVADAAKIARVAQDLAVIGGENSSETARNLTEAIANQNVQSLKQYGIILNSTDVFEQYAKTLGKTGDDLTDVERKQAFVNKILNEGEKVAGTYEMAMGTVGKKITSLPRLFEEAANTVGGVFLPVLDQLVTGLSSILSAIPSTPALLIPFKALASVLVIVGEMAYTVANGIVTIGKAIKALFTGQNVWNVFKEGQQNLKDSFKDTTTKLNEIWTGSSKLRLEAFNTELQEEEAAMSEHARKLAKQLAEENEEYLHQLERRQASFEDSLADLIWSHQDKVEEIKDQISEENKNYSEKLSERLSDFKKTMKEMVKAHQQKIDDINKQLNRENEDYAESSSLKSYEHEKAVKEIMEQIDKETAKGKNASKTKLEMLQKQLNDINENYAQETATAAKNHERQVEDLQTSLARENEAYDQSVADKKEALDKQNADALEAHQKNISDYQATLDTEQKILNDHQDQVNQVKDKARRDDIQRLLDQYADENAEALRQHNKRVADLKEQGAVEAKTLTDSYVNTLNQQSKYLNDNVNKVGTDAGNSMSEGAKKGILSKVGETIDIFVSNLRSKLGLVDWNDVFKFAQNPVKAILHALNVPGFAGGITNFGGGIALVGEKGPELVNLPKGSDVIPNNVAFSGNGIGGKSVNQQIYINIDKVGNMGDIDSLGREFGFRAGLIPA